MSIEKIAKGIIEKTAGSVEKELKQIDDSMKSMKKQRDFIKSKYTEAEKILKKHNIKISSSEIRFLGNAKDPILDLYCQTVPLNPKTKDEDHTKAYNELSKKRYFDYYLDGGLYIKVK